jgi:hypothetical protein
MVWDDLADAWNVIGHNLNDVFYSLSYIVENLANAFLIIFYPINFAFNFFKGFFDGITTVPPETAISWTFDPAIVEIFNTIPYWSLLMFAVGGGLAIIVLVFVISQLLKL